MTQFNPKEYWQRRLESDFDLHGVGRRNWGPYFNRWAYRVRRFAFMRMLKQSPVDFTSADVLDIGSGTGFYIDCWKQLGVRSVTGADLTEVSVERLRTQYPDCEFHRLDIGGDVSALPPQKFDVVSCMDVLFHITDDVAYEKAMHNVFRILKPGGYFVFSEGFIRTDTRRITHVVHRNSGEIRRILGAAGFRIVGHRPFLVVMNDPIEKHTGVLRFAWRASQIAVHRCHPLGAVIGALLYPAEICLVSCLRQSPSTEIMLCQRPPEGELPEAERTTFGEGAR